MPNMPLVFSIDIHVGRSTEFIRLGSLRTKAENRKRVPYGSMLDSASLAGRGSKSQIVIFSEKTLAQTRTFIIEEFMVSANLGGSGPSRYLPKWTDRPRSKKNWNPKIYIYLPLHILLGSLGDVEL